MHPPLFSGQNHNLPSRLLHSSLPVNSCQPSKRCYTSPPLPPTVRVRDAFALCTLVVFGPALFCPVRSPSPPLVGSATHVSPARRSPRPPAFQVRTSS